MAFKVMVFEVLYWLSVTWIAGCISAVTAGWALDGRLSFLNRLIQFLAEKMGIQVTNNRPTPAWIACGSAARWRREKTSLESCRPALPAFAGWARSHKARFDKSQRMKPSSRSL
ncbi:MAG: hypothetical protein AXW13_05580 [Alcanivorax sp. Nap_24]|jgi:hypothetical protein|nr:MAG: hypothetical protein AXW13_05580 [Alcanivorax sp. Nap_24]|tara:strand:+ start:9518 stop:9859 length:342 start_codon:yes stop_codon:yes gene_type:complete